MTEDTRIPLRVVFEDQYLLVLDKPAGLVIHPGRGHSKHTLVKVIRSHCPHLPRFPRRDRPGIVHRLDKDTSGLMVVAKSTLVQERMIRQFSAHLVQKTYLALVDGVMTRARGIIEGPIGRDPDDSKRMAVVEGGREARTRYRVIELRSAHTLIEAIPETGRTHQIRVHLAAIGYPVCGDKLYGQNSQHLNRQFLHACRLVFEHPITEAKLDFSSPLPPDLRKALEDLR
ncbi:MAG: RluA family pseudouridine synthase [Chloroflexi bacterium]|nr:RluA family pseudouridine synthase [Chloroflexota bacterium]